LNMLNGLIKPDTGKIEMRGRVGALIALGAGFNPILTGRENIYISGSILGLSTKEIDDKIEEMIDFSEIKDFIDAPVQTYSSGMQVRLGFSVASAMKPDILILDEVLAVGDVGFVIKCLNRVRELANDCAVILVSHSMQYISSFCTRVLVMEGGVVNFDTLNPSKGINCYYSMMKISGSESGTGEVKLQSFVVYTGDQLVEEHSPVIKQYESVEVRLIFEVSQRKYPVKVELIVGDETQSSVVSYPFVKKSGDHIGYDAGNHKIQVSLGKMDFTAGQYSFKILVTCFETNAILLKKTGLYPFRITSEYKTWAKITRPVVMQK
jgi:lipopolysaccharide transport system ATP-binding protein